MDIKGVEYIDNGERVIIPAKLWEEIRKIAEFIDIHEIIEQRKNSEPIYDLDDLLKQEGLTRENLQD